MGLDARMLEPGRDLVLDMSRRQGDELPVGVLLDDCLSRDVRQAIDRKAIGALAAWRARWDAELTLDGVCIPHIWEVELLAEVFLPETRIVSGLRAALADGARRRIEVEGVDADRANCLATYLRPLGIEVQLSRVPVSRPRYASPLLAPWPSRLPRRIASAILRVTGVPQRVNGEVYFLPYWHLRAVAERLAGSDSPRFVADPGLETFQTLLRISGRGGWVGHPGARKARRSRRLLGAALANARLSVDDSDPLSRMLHLRALAMLEQRAGDTLADVWRMRKAFASGRVKLALLPFDSPPNARAVVQAARETGVATLVVQHGFHAEPNEPDKTLADVVAVWSEADVRYLSDRSSARIELTGNPGVTNLADLIEDPPQRRDSGRTIVLVEYASRLSARVDNRVSIRHLDAALRALAEARPNTVAIIRPHPSEHEPDIFVPLTSRFPRLRVVVDGESPISEVISTADLLIGAVSTATLEAAAAGVPVIFLNVTGWTAPWPFDGSTDVPLAASAEELATLIPRVLSSGDVPGRAEMLDALGVKADATDRVVELISALVRRPAL
jgi:hypothetical protein